MSKEEFRNIVNGASEPVEIPFTQGFRLQHRGRDRLQQRKFFSDIVRFLYGPRKPEVLLAQATNSTERMARYWLNGKSEPSGSVKLLVIAEVIDRLK